MSHPCGGFSLMPDVETLALFLPVCLCESTPARELGMMPALAKRKKHENLTRRGGAWIVLVLFFSVCRSWRSTLGPHCCAPARGKGVASLPAPCGG